MLFLARFGNGDDSWLTHYPRERDLRRGRVVALGDPFERRVLKQAAAVTNWRVGHYRHLIVSAPLQKTGFNLPVFQIVENLISGAVPAVFNRPEFLHVIDIEIRDAPAFDLANGPKFLERLHRFHEARISFSPVQ